MIINWSNSCYGFRNKSGTFFLCSVVVWFSLKTEILLVFSAPFFSRLDQLRKSKYTDIHLLTLKSLFSSNIRKTCIWNNAHTDMVFFGSCLSNFPVNMQPCLVASNNAHGSKWMSDIIVHSYLQTITSDCNTIYLQHRARAVVLMTQSGLSFNFGDLSIFLIDGAV